MNVDPFPPIMALSMFFGRKGSVRIAKTVRREDVRVSKALRNARRDLAFRNVSFSFLVSSFKELFPKAAGS